MNRVNNGCLWICIFAPWAKVRQSLKRKSSGILYCVVTGNTALMLKLTVQDGYHHEVLDQLDPDKKVIQFTHASKRKSRSADASGLWALRRNGGSGTDY